MLIQRRDSLSPSLQWLSRRRIVIDFLLDCRQNAKENGKGNVDWLDEETRRTKEEQEDDRCLFEGDQSMNNKDESLIFVSRISFFNEILLANVSLICSLHSLNVENLINNLFVDPADAKR